MAWRQLVAEQEIDRLHPPLEKALEVDWQFAFERAEMLRQFQSDLLASIGHELRTPLNSQMGALQMILADLCDSPLEEREYLHVAKIAVERSLKLLEEYTKLSQHHSPVMQLQLQPVELLPILKEAAALTILQARDRGIHYDWPCLQEQITCQSRVYTDPHGLLQALLGICRWSIIQLRHGIIRSQVLLRNHELRLTLELEGQRDVLRDTESIDLTWSVGQRLLQKMQASLTLHNQEAGYCLIEIRLPTYT